jgi:hypothetical protein
MASAAAPRADEGRRRHRRWAWVKTTPLVTKGYASARKEYRRDDAEKPAPATERKLCGTRRYRTGPTWSRARPFCFAPFRQMDDRTQPWSILADDILTRPQERIRVASTTVPEPSWSVDTKARIENL